MKIDFGDEARLEILRTSLLVEKFVTSFLALLIGIEDQDNSKTLGNKSTSLSFNQKIDILIDMGALNNLEKKKFQTFMEIRNQFMHNIMADSYVSCFNFINGKESFLLKEYPQTLDNSREEQLRTAVVKLSTEIFELIITLTDHIQATAKPREKIREYYLELKRRYK